MLHRRCVGHSLHAKIAGDINDVGYCVTIFVDQCPAGIGRGKERGDEGQEDTRTTTIPNDLFKHAMPVLSW
jgi:hypothetical protein